ncbi:MAG TPA: hypothetical protein PLP42_19090, partial [Acidobacteriota bacterium]|nr:hypothetical protein [Acidobacteriota bacterium]
MRTSGLSQQTRREFCTKVAGGVAALGIPGRFTFVQPSEKKLRVAIVGGNFGSTFHFHEHPDCIV